MDNPAINSKAYWDHRFETDWEDNRGREQSRFFARVAIENLPDWLKSYVITHHLVICDWGCAEGDGTDILASYFGQQQVVGVDFSTVAIERARRYHPHLNFSVEDWLEAEDPNPRQYDIIFSSNTLEHFSNPQSVLEKLSARAKKMVVLMVPFREFERIAEHQYTFLPENIRVAPSPDLILLYTAVIDTANLSPSFWAGEQIVLVYGRTDWVVRTGLGLSHAQIDVHLSQALTERDARIAKLKQIAEDHERALQALTAQVVEREQAIEVLSAQLADRERAVQQLSAQLAEREQTNEKLQAEVQNLRYRVVELEQAFTNYRADKEIYIAQLRDRLSWKRYRLVDVLIAPFWYLRHPQHLARRIYWSLPSRMQTIVRGLFKGTILSKIREPWGPFKGGYVVEDNSHVTLFTTNPELFAGYEPRVDLRFPIESRQRVKVTLIAPAKNEADSVDWWWQGILAQTRLPDEVIVVESSSTDGTLERLHELAARSPVPFRVISAPGANIAKARNIAIREANHDVIACIDFGSHPRPNWLEKLIAPFEINPKIQVVGGWYEPVHTDGSPVRHRCWWPDIKKIQPQSFLPSNRSFAFKKDAWESVGGYPEWLTLTGEDTYFVLELKRQVGAWALVPEAIVDWIAPDFIWGYALKMFRWATGDGESGVHGQYYWPLAINILVGFVGLGAGSFLLLVLVALMFKAAYLLWAVILVVSWLILWTAILIGWPASLAGVRCPGVLVGRAAAVVGFVVGARRRSLVESRRWAQVKSVWFILSGVPIDDTGGGARATQIALELLHQGCFVIFISKFPKYESRELGLKFTHPNLKVHRINEFNWSQFAKTHAYLLKNKPLAALIEFPVADFLQIVDSIREAGGRIVYDLIDDWSTSLGGNWYSPDVEKIFIEKADLLTATAPVLAEHLRKMSGREVHLLSNAVNARLFDPSRHYPRPEDMPNADWTMIYIGALWGEWFDWGLLIRLADVYPNAAVVVIGDYQGQCPEPRPNLHFLGLKSQRDLPAYLAHSDVAIIPWKVNKITLATSPLKVYEYLAMRRPVVAPDLPPLRGIPSVWLAQNQEDFVSLTSTIRGLPYPQGEVTCFISENSWQAHVSKLTDLTFSKDQP